jgi:ABC-type branched-subunit amino acid transport system substrate-binding protein
MKLICKHYLKFVLVIVALFLTFQNPGAVNAAKKAKVSNAPKAAAMFEADKMADMSDYDPSNPVVPTGDTIKIAIVAAFSGPSAFNGQMDWNAVQWVAHDLNKRGGIWVDGKKKLIQVIKADHMSKADQCKKVCERMALQEKVHVVWGTDGSHMMKIINETAKKYKIISVNVSCMSNNLMDVANFSPYSFMTATSTEQVGRALAYYYGQRNKEKKFYILNQDYSFGHELAEGFKDGLKEYYPGAQLVGEDYHKLFLTDFAPYITKIAASGAEVIFTGDWSPDNGNMLKQARQMGVKLPVASVYFDEPNSLHENGVEGTEGIVCVNPYVTGNPFFKTPGDKKFYTAWNNQWKNKWKTSPYNTRLFEHGSGNTNAWIMHTYWLMSVIERAKSTDPEKIIKVWEGDTYRTVTGKVLKMRVCDHKAIQDLAVVEYVTPEQQKVSFNMPPYYWFKGISFIGPTFVVPAEKILPWMDQKIDRCKGKNNWGE